MRTQLLNALLLLLICSFSTCITHYVPPPINNPMLSQEAEVIANASIASGEATATTNFNIAYSPVQNIGIGYSYSGYDVSTTTTINGATTTDKLYNGNYNELMGGYYKSFGKHGLLECYTGFGLGGSNNYYANTNSTGTSKLKFTRAFIMPSVGAKFKYFQASYGVKLYQVNFYKNELFNVADYRTADLVYRLNDKPYYFISHAAMLKFGYKNFFAFTQLGVNRKLSANIIDYEHVNFSLGIQFQFITRGPRYKKPMNDE